MQSFRRQIKRQQSCQSCLTLTYSLKEYSKDKSRLTADIFSLQDILIQLKQDVKSLRIENISAEAGLKEKAKLWKRPEESFIFSSIDDTDYELPKSSLSITSRPPLVRPRISRHISKIIIQRPSSPPSEEKFEINVIPEEELNEFHIPQGQPGCEVCVSLENQIRREIGEIRLMNKSLHEKREEIANYQKQADQLEKNKHELKRQITKLSNNSEFNLRTSIELERPSSLDLFAYQSSFSVQTPWYRSSESLRRQELLEKTERIDHETFYSLLQEYRTGQKELRSLQANQDYIVEQMCTLFLQAENSNSSSSNVSADK